MVSFNRVVLGGNLTRDPELRFTQEGVPVCGFSIAVNRVRSRKSEAVDFFNVSAWRELGEAVANHKKKGDPVLVEGRLKYRAWQTADGAKRSAVDVVADNVRFLGRSGSDPQQQAEDPAGADKAPGKTSGGAGGWGLAAKQQAEGNGTNSEEEELKEEDFDDIPF